MRMLHLEVIAEQPLSGHERCECVDRHREGELYRESVWVDWAVGYARDDEDWQQREESGGKRLNEGDERATDEHGDEEEGSKVLRMVHATSGSGAGAEWEWSGSWCGSGAGVEWEWSGSGVGVEWEWVC